MRLDGLFSRSTVHGCGLAKMFGKRFKNQKGLGKYCQRWGYICSFSPPRNYLFTTNATSNIIVLSKTNSKCTGRVSSKTLQTTVFSEIDPKSIAIRFIECRIKGKGNSMPLCPYAGWLMNQLIDKTDINRQCHVLFDSQIRQNGSEPRYGALARVLMGSFCAQSSGLVPHSVIAAIVYGVPHLTVFGYHLFVTPDQCVDLSK